MSKQGRHTAYKVYVYQTTDVDMSPDIKFGTNVALGTLGHVNKVEEISEQKAEDLQQERLQGKVTD